MWSYTNSRTAQTFENYYFYNIINTTKTILSKMKKNYTSPAIETTEVMVEAGIAVSLQAAGFGFDETDATYTEEEGLLW